MFGSQALETAIGLVMMFFVISLATSSIVEIGARLVSKRAKHLEVAIRGMLGTASQPSATGSPTDIWDAFTATSVYDAARSAAGKPLGGHHTGDQPKWKRPSYLSAAAFATGIHEIALAEAVAAHVGVAVVESHVVEAMKLLPGNVGKRVAALDQEFKGNLTDIKAGLESWFDANMDRLQGAYKRWATTLLFLVGIAIAAGSNASTFHVAQRLWSEPTTRQIVIAAADRVAVEPIQDSTNKNSNPVETIGGNVARAQSIGLPVGWDAKTRGEIWGWALPGYIAGWLATGLLVTLGAPFWFDLLTRLVSLRTSGVKPPLAKDDPASATSRRGP